MQEIRPLQSVTDSGDTRAVFSVSYVAFYSPAVSTRIARFPWRIDARPASFS